MNILMTILGLMNSAKALSQGDRFGGALGALGVLNSSGWFGNSTPSYNNTLSDAGVRRNFL